VTRVLVLDAAGVRAACPMADAITAVEAGFTALSAHRADVPLREVLGLGAGAQMLVMSASSPDFPLASVKVVSVADGNRALGLATIQAAVMLVDARTGAPRALLDGAALTALRTGAAGGLAARRLAPARCDVVALYGAGVQAATQLEGLLVERTPREVRVVAPTAAHVEAFIARWPLPSGGRYVRADRGAAVGAQVVICATSSTRPVFDASDLAEDAHLTGVGSFRPDACEFAPELLRGARVVVDHRPAAISESGEVITALRLGLIAENDLIEIGEPAARRVGGDHRTIFKSVGNGIQDLAVGCRVVERAQVAGIGTWVEL
jgi:alanine dehydrogenase